MDSDSSYQHPPPMGGTERRPPKGYRLLREGEIIPENRIIWSGGNGPWRIPRSDSRIGIGRKWDGPKGILAPVAVPIHAPAPKAPRKAPKLPETSLEAKESQKDKAPVDREIIMGHMKKHPRGTTCDRLEVLLGMSHQTTSARINDLARAGRIVDSGRREKTRTGRNAICWKVVGK